MDDGYDHPSQDSEINLEHDYDHMGLTPAEVATLIALERAGAGLSIFGIALIFVTYWAYKRMRTVPNLFILFASIANAGASAACLIGYDGIHQGENSALCQAQAFLLEMLMQSDPWWSFAMAVNVFLVFFYGANPASFRKHLWIYCLVCFGAPFIPALALLLIKDAKRGPVYGDATLWCWIGSTWNTLRIYTYYMPIWLCIFLSGVIYFAVGYHVFHQRNQLRNITFSTHTEEGDKVVTASDVRGSAEKNLTDGQDGYGSAVTAVTEVRITTDSQKAWPPPQSPTKPPRVMKSTDSLYAQRPWTSRDEEIAEPPAVSGDTQSRFETTCSSVPLPPQPKRHRNTRSVWARFVQKLKNLDPIKLAYLRTSFIFAISVLVTWTPSSINRVHNIVHKDQTNFGLNVASAVVLPLQGVWNAVIYFITSWAIFKAEWTKTWTRCKAKHTWMRFSNASSNDTGTTAGAGEGAGAHGRGSGGRGRLDELDVLELSPPRMGTVRTLRGSF